MPSLAYAITASILVAVNFVPQAAFGGVEDVRTPRGAFVRLLVEPGDNPFATVVLFAGGPGVVDISASGQIGKLAGNFLVAVRHHFQKAGANTVVIDAPSDRRDNLHGFRQSQNHADDVAAVVKHLRDKYKQPVWLIGTSRGTESVANAGARLTAGDGKPAGIVLTSSITLPHYRVRNHVLDSDLDKVVVPVLIAHHKEDACEFCPPANVEVIRAALKNAKPVKVLWYEGGEGMKGDPCEPHHYHGFVGIRNKVVNDIMAWIKNPSG
ncbi:MAG: alpha/beta hydrolase [Rhodospirillales bacterium]|nr:alpha/beta hydrolase [Rhodospirillales bacterium]